MTVSDAAIFSSTLSQKYHDLTRSIRNRDEITIENAAETLDQVQRMGERELAIRTLDLNSDLLRQIRRAQARIRDGSFGMCLHCEENIAVKRLHALPWAAYCIKCQERVDQRDADITEDIGLADVA